MSMNVRADVSYLFSGLGSSAANVASSDFLGQYASIKNGSYAKLMKAYYGKNSNDSVNSIVKESKNKSTLSSDDAKKIAQVQSTTDSLKESADALLVKGDKSLFAMKDIVTKDENGEETTVKGYDTEAIYKAVSDFVKDYNEVIKAVEEVDNKSVINRTSTMVNASISNLKLLNQVGITINADSTLSLDKTAFDKADMTTVKTLFNGNGSYGYSVSAQASMINFAADQVVSKANTYTVGGTYNNNYNTGNFFNSYF